MGDHEQHLTRDIVIIVLGVGVTTAAVMAGVVGLGLWALTRFVRLLAKEDA